jgi:hypothetical protein
MTVTTPTSIIGVRGTQFRVAFEDPASGTARTEVLEGKVRTDNALQKVGSDVGGGFGVAVKPNEREIKVVQLLPALPESALPAKIGRGEDRQANWTVAALSGAAAYRAEIARDEQFSQIVQDAKSNAPSLDFSRVPNGAYYARVRGVDASGIEGYNAMRRIEIADDIKLIWVREVHLSASAEQVPQGLQLRVYSGSADFPKTLQVQVASDPGMTQNLRTLSINPSSGVPGVLIPGVKASEQMYVRFVGQTPNQALQPSPVMRLSVPDNWGDTVFGMSSALLPLN